MQDILDDFEDILVQMRETRKELEKCAIAVFKQQVYVNDGGISNGNKLVHHKKQAKTASK